MRNRPLIRTGVQFPPSPHMKTLPLGSFFICGDGASKLLCLRGELHHKSISIFILISFLKNWSKPERCEEV